MVKAFCAPLPPLSIFLLLLTFFLLLYEVQTLKLLSTIIIPFLSTDLTRFFYWHFFLQNLMTKELKNLEMGTYW